MKAIRADCQATTVAGTRCQAAAIPGSDFCFFHDPGRANERRDAQAQGGRHGRMTTLDDADADIAVATSRDIVTLMSATINQVRKGQLDPRIANAVGYLATVALKAIDQGDTEARLAALEAVVQQRRPATTDFLDLAS